MRLLRNIVIVLVLLAAVAAGAAFTVAGNAKAMSFMLREALARTVKTVQVKELSSANLVYTFPSSWSFRNARIRLGLSGKELTLFAARVDVDGAARLFSPGQAVPVIVSKADISWDKFKASGVSILAALSRGNGGVNYHGDISAAEAGWDKIGVSVLKSAFAGDVRVVAFNHMTADVYGGKLSGEATVTFAVAGYEADVVVDKADTVQLERALGGAFREFGGKVSGRVKVKGHGDRIDSLDTAWDMPLGGQVSAVLLSSIATYLPSSAEKKRLDSLIRSGGKLAVEVFSFTIRNDSPDHLSGEIGLKSREANLELNVAHDVRVDARIDSLLKAWSAIFK